MRQHAPYRQLDQARGVPLVQLPGRKRAQAARPVGPLEVIHLFVPLLARQAHLIRLTTMTKSPVSTWGVYCGLCLPRNTAATWLANRPKVLPLASMTYHLRSTLPGFAMKVRLIGLSSFLAAVPFLPGKSRGQTRY